MKRVIRTILFATSIVAIGCVTADTTHAGNAPKVDLYGPLGHPSCENSPPSGDAGDWGFVIFHTSPHGTISAKVSLKNAAPNATFAIFVIQDGDCLKGIDGTLTTNAQGNGTASVSVESVGTWASISVYSEIGVNQEFASGVFEH